MEQEGRFRLNSGSALRRLEVVASDEEEKAGVLVAVFGQLAVRLVLAKCEANSRSLPLNGLLPEVFPWS